MCPKIRQLLHQFTQQWMFSQEYTFRYSYFHVIPQKVITKIEQNYKNHAKEDDNHQFIQLYSHHSILLADDELVLKIPVENISRLFSIKSSFNSFEHSLLHKSAFIMEGTVDIFCIQSFKRTTYSKKNICSLICNVWTALSELHNVSHMNVRLARDMHTCLWDIISL